VGNVEDLTDTIAQRNQGMTQLLTEHAEGVYIIAATPFTDSADIDWASVDGMIEFYIGHGVTGITILGMMGEACSAAARAPGPRLDADDIKELDSILARLSARLSTVKRQAAA
jgi:4-hydroxy-tetrahydrodipicolinate synthase